MVYVLRQVALLQNTDQFFKIQGGMDQLPKAMAKALKGDRSFIPANKQIIIPTLVVNQANVADFTKKINELRGR